jgi:hypothetical protein
VRKQLVAISGVPTLDGLYLLTYRLVRLLPAEANQRSTSLGARTALVWAVWVLFIQGPSMSNAPALPGTPVIASARITAMPKQLFDPMPQVIVIDSNEKETTLFEYYPDEISFCEKEFIGLTLDQACRLKFSKDKAYLQS